MGAVVGAWVAGVRRLEWERPRMAVLEEGGRGASDDGGDGGDDDGGDGGDGGGGDHDASRLGGISTVVSVRLATPPSSGGGGGANANGHGADGVPPLLVIYDTQPASISWSEAQCTATERPEEVKLKSGWRQGASRNDQSERGGLPANEAMVFQDRPPVPPCGRVVAPEWDPAARAPLSRR